MRRVLPVAGGALVGFVEGTLAKRRPVDAGGVGEVGGVVAVGVQQVVVGEGRQGAKGVHKQRHLVEGVQGSRGKLHVHFGAPRHDLQLGPVALLGTDNGGECQHPLLRIRGGGRCHSSGRHLGLVHVVDDVAPDAADGEDASLGRRGLVPGQHGHGLHRGGHARVHAHMLHRDARRVRMQQHHHGRLEQAGEVATQQRVVEPHLGSRPLRAPGAAQAVQHLEQAPVK
uniref:Putative secreted protein n=1 Tax=Ixodes ricinus TaxID=34613 RepID=A0A6B0V3N2_IXORI